MNVLRLEKACALACEVLHYKLSFITHHGHIKTFDLESEVTQRDLFTIVLDMVLYLTLSLGDKLLILFKFIFKFIFFYVALNLAITLLHFRFCFVCVRVVARSYSASRGREQRQQALELPAQLHSCKNFYDTFPPDCKYHFYFFLNCDLNKTNKIVLLSTFNLQRIYIRYIKKKFALVDQLFFVFTCRTTGST